MVRLYIYSVQLEHLVKDKNIFTNVLYTEKF